MILARWSVLDLRPAKPDAYEIQIVDDGEQMKLLRRQGKKEAVYIKHHYSKQETLWAYAKIHIAHILKHKCLVYPIMEPYGQTAIPPIHSRQTGDEEIE